MTSLDQAMDAPSIMPSRRQLLLGGMMLAFAGAAVALEPRRSATVLEDGALDKAVPNTIGAYHYVSASGLVVPAESELSKRLYDQVLTRVYAADDLPSVMLLIAYGGAQNSNLQMHRPEYCYPGNGYAIKGSQKVPLGGYTPAGSEATYLMATKDNRMEQVFYWTRVGKVFPATSLEERRAVAHENLAGRLPDGVLVRSSVESADRKAALRQLEAFNDALVGSLSGEGRRLILGSGLTSV